MPMDADSKRRTAWVAGNLLPIEGDVRAWLLRRLNRPDEADDLIQEAYCRAWTVTELGAILNPKAYFFRTVRNILIDQVRRAAVVQIGLMADIESAGGQEDLASPERILSARQDLNRVQTLIDALPDRCRRIVIMRKIRGMSQREIAHECGVTESVVENDLRRGLSLVLKAFEIGEPAERSRTADRRASNSL